MSSTHASGAGPTSTRTSCAMPSSASTPSTSSVTTSASTLTTMRELCLRVSQEMGVVFQSRYSRKAQWQNCRVGVAVFFFFFFDIISLFR